jgi:hypothetical protein
VFRGVSTSHYRLCQRCKIEQKKGKPQSAGYAVPNKYWDNHLWVVHRIKRVKDE